MATLAQHAAARLAAAPLRVVILAPVPLAAQRTLLATHFGRRPAAAAASPPPPLPPPFGAAGADRLYVLPAASGAAVALTWVWPSQARARRHQADTYVASALEDTSAGSLHAALRRRGWAVAVAAGVEDDGFSITSGYWLFRVRCFTIAHRVVDDERVLALPGALFCSVHRVVMHEWLLALPGALLHPGTAIVPEQTAPEQCPGSWPVQRSQRSRPGHSFVSCNAGDGDATVSTVPSMQCSLHPQVGIMQCR